MDLVEAMVDFRTRHPRASNRQETIQLYCCAELARRGLPGVQIEVRMPGFYRVKKWDCGLLVEDEPQLGISCKSIVSNHAGTVPNRVDDMLGEAVSLHRAYPRAVLGYLFMMSRRDEKKKGPFSADQVAKLHDAGDAWFERLVESVSRASGRAEEGDVPEKFEVVSCSQIDFDADPYGIVVHGGALSPDRFFDRLVEIHSQRFT